MKSSVVLCTYNGAHFLGEQLHSLLTQTVLPDEIIIQDDQSEDDTWCQLQQFAEQALHQGVSVHLFRNPRNLGYVKNFETALQKSSGEIIFLADQDDIWHPDKLERYLAQFTQRPDLGLLHSDADLVDGNARPMGHRLFEVLRVTREELAAIHCGDVFPCLLRRNLMTGATMAIRRKVLDLALPVEEGWIHDEWLAVIAAAAMQVDCLEWSSMGYRQHENNQIGARKAGWRDNLRRLVRLRRYHIRQLCIRMECLRQRLRQLPADMVSPAYLACLDERIEHGRHRAAMPDSLPARLKLIRAETGRKHYRKFASGWKSIAVDILNLH